MVDIPEGMVSYYMYYFGSSAVFLPPSLGVFIAAV